MNPINYFKSHSLKQVINRIDYYFGLGRLELLISSRWFNPLATLWMNFRLLPFTKAVRLPIWAFGAPRFRNLSGRVVIDAKVRSGMMRVNAGRVAPPAMTGGNSEFFLAGTLLLHGRTKICTSVYIAISKEATLELGNDSLLCEYVNIGCHRHITIGHNAWLTHRCQAYDSNYHYIEDMNSGTISEYTAPVKIGDGCWVCNSSTIGPGTCLPTNTVVSSNSLVNKNLIGVIPENSLIGGVPAKLIRTGLRRLDREDLIKAASNYHRAHQGTPYPFK